MQFVLQFRIKPGTYDKGPSTLKETPQDADVPERFKIDDGEKEWFTNRHGVHILYGILVRKV